MELRISYAAKTIKMHRWSHVQASLKAVMSGVLDNIIIQAEMAQGERGLINEGNSNNLTEVVL